MLMKHVRSSFALQKSTKIKKANSPVRTLLLTENKHESRKNKTLSRFLTSTSSKCDVFIVPRSQIRRMYFTKTLELPMFEECLEWEGVLYQWGPLSTPPRTPPRFWLKSHGIATDRTRYCALSVIRPPGLTPPPRTPPQSG